MGEDAESDVVIVVSEFTPVGQYKPMTICHTRCLRIQPSPAGGIKNCPPPDAGSGVSKVAPAGSCQQRAHISAASIIVVSEAPAAVSCVTIMCSRMMSASFGISCVSAFGLGQKASRVNPSSETSIGPYGTQLSVYWTVMSEIGFLAR